MELKRVNGSGGRKKAMVSNLQDTKKTSNVVYYSLRLKETHRMEEETQRIIRNYFIKY